MLSRRDFVKSSMLSSACLAASRMPVLGEVLGLSPAASAMRFGANFTPRKHWWYCWQDWDHQAIADDLSGIASLGLDHIRVQCLWPLFQPGISTVSGRLLDHLHTLLDEADRVGLDVEVTVLNGWMSGLSFLPAWVAPLANRNGTDHNIFTSPTIIEAEKLLFRRIAETVGRHRRFLGFDIGNELGVLQSSGSNPVSRADADAWATEILGYCDEIAPGKFHVNGVDHSHWFNDFGFSRQQIATTGHASVVHSYIYFDGVLDRYKYSEVGSLHLAEYEVELAYAYQTDVERRVWVEEIGVGNKEMPESYKPEFMEHSVRNIASTGKAWGVTWWSSHDIDLGVKGFDDYEYGLGLLDLQNRPKPTGRKFAELASELKRSAIKIPVRKTALVIPDYGLSGKAWPPDWKYARPFMDLIDKGLQPSIVLESRRKDRAYLQKRGITDLVPLA